MIPRSAFLASVVCIAFTAASASSSSSSSVAIPAESTSATASATSSVISSFASPPIILRLSTSHTRIPSSHYHHDHGSMTRRKGAASSYFGYLRPKTTTATVHRRNNCINNNSIRSKKSAPTTITALQMALTEEFVQMKINGDVSSSTSLFTDGSSSMDTNFGEVGNDDGGSSSWDGRILNMEDSRGKSATEEPTTTTTGTTTLAAPASSSVPPPTSSARRGNHPTRAVPTKQRGNTGRESSSNSNNNSNDVLRTKFLQPFLSGRMALSTVQSLARVAGAGSGDMGKLFNANNNGDDDVDVNAYPTTSSSSSRRNRNINDDTRYRDDNKDTIEDDNDANDNSNNMDGFNKGAFGIANVLSHRRGGVSSNSRTQVIQWQRESLKSGRKEVWDRASSSSNGGGNTKREEGGKIDEYNSRMTPLVGILQKSAKDRSRNKSTTNNNNNNKQQQDQTTITAALKTIENDMAILDVLASLQPQLSGTEVGLLLGAIVVSGVGPIFFPGTSVTEVLAPAAAAFTASITIGSEYIGRVAVADGKEIAANTIQCAAEAEALLANAERVKAITPLCVGVGATCASFALLTPAIIDVLNIGNSVIMIAELYLLCPLVSVLAAAVANLALEETRGYASQAINVGVRRFSKRTAVGRTWLSSVEQIQKASVSKTGRWWSFAGSVLPAPILGSIVGGPSLSAKCIVVAALAAAQSAYFLAQAEGVLARATDAVALKARSAAVCDTYANQGARNSAILPFTSALSAFCAAATAATVELPFIDTISSLYGTIGEVVVVSTFPLLSSAFAAAAAVSKARCEVDAEAAAQAASTLALEYMDGSGDDPVLRPFREVRELVRLAVTSGWRSIKKGVLNPFENIWKVGRKAIMGFRWRMRSNRSRGGGLT